MKVTRDIFFNNHTSAHDKKRLRQFVNAEKYLPISLPFDTEQEGNEKLIPHLKFLISPKMSPMLVPDEELMKLPPILLFTTEFDILRDEGRRIQRINES